MIDFPIELKESRELGVSWLDSGVPGDQGRDESPLIEGERRLLPRGQNPEQSGSVGSFLDSTEPIEQAGQSGEGGLRDPAERGGEVRKLEERGRGVGVEGHSEGREGAWSPLGAEGGAVGKEVATERRHPTPLDQKGLGTPSSSPQQ